MKKGFYFSIVMLMLAAISACSNMNSSAQQALSTATEVQEKVPQKMAATSSEPIDPALLEKGAKVFKYRCAACHSMDPNKSQFFGPHLYQIVDREIATVAGYSFPNSVKQLDIVWTETVLEEWLEHPQQMVADMCMPFTGLSKAEDRAALMAYMKSVE